MCPYHYEGLIHEGQYIQVCVSIFQLGPFICDGCSSCTGCGGCDGQGLIERDTDDGVAFGDVLYYLQAPHPIKVSKLHIINLNRSATRYACTTGVMGARGLADACCMMHCSTCPLLQLLTKAD